VLGINYEDSSYVFDEDERCVIEIIVAADQEAR